MSLLRGNTLHFYSSHITTAPLSTSIATHFIDFKSLPEKNSKKCSMLIPMWKIQIPQIINKGTKAQRGKLGHPQSKQRTRIPSPHSLLVYHSASTHSQILTQVPLWTRRQSHSLEKGSCKKTCSGGTKDQTSGKNWSCRWIRRVRSLSSYFFAFDIHFQRFCFSPGAGINFQRGLIALS